MLGVLSEAWSVMTVQKNFKRLVRARAAKTGESYQAALRQLRADAADTGTGTEAHVEAIRTYFEAWEEHLHSWQLNGGPYQPFRVAVPLEAMQWGALRHSNAAVRRSCLDVLDHKANDASKDVFRSALADPVPAVRVIALHGLSCERCREGDLCVADVVPDLIDLLRRDDSPKVRHAVLLPLALLADRDERIGKALAVAAHNDLDSLVRRVAADVLEFGQRGYKSRKATRRRLRLRPDNGENPAGGQTDAGTSV